MRMAQLPPACGEESTSGGKLVGHDGRRNPAKVRFARDDSGRSNPPAPHPRRARAVHHHGLPFHDDAADCQEAGVAEGTIYRHFDSKQHLLNELYRAAGRWAVRVVKEADGLKVGPREKLAELGRGLVAGAAREPAVAQLFFVQRHADLLDDESRKVARDFRLGLESLMAQGKADGSVKPGAVELWAAVWLGVMSLVIERVAGKELPEKHAGVALALEAASESVAAPCASALSMLPPCRTMYCHISGGLNTTIGSTK